LVYRNRNSNGSGYNEEVQFILEKIRLGRTGMMVSRVGFGGIPIQRLTEDEAVAVVRRCLDLGITFLDSSHAYSNSEERIGKVIAGRREELVLSTRTPSRTGDGAVSDLNLSLERLGTDYIDLYDIHAVNNLDSLKTILAPGGSMETLRKAKRDGVVKHIGLTTHSLDVAKESVKSGHFETVMVALNFVNDAAANELLPLAKEHDVGIIAMKPLAGGMLDNVTLAFKYLLGFPNVLPLVGIDKTEYIEEIVRIVAAPWSMSATEQHEMKRLKEELGTRFCRSCDYCQPCSEGIMISLVLSAQSFVKRNPPEPIFNGRLVEVIEQVASCQKCGECETRCPYGLPIMDMINEEADWFLQERRKFLEQRHS
jgi:predicted aldo/keto reductase-like oxidoreductase